MEVPETLSTKYQFHKARAEKIMKRIQRWQTAFYSSDETMRIKLCNENLKDLPYMPHVNRVLLQRNFSRLIDTPDRLLKSMVPISLGLKQFLTEQERLGGYEFRSSDTVQYAYEIQRAVISGEMSIDLANNLGEICLGTMQTRAIFPLELNVCTLRYLGKTSTVALEKYIEGLKLLNERVDNNDGRPIRRINSDKIKALSEAGLVSEKNVPAVIAASSRMGEELSDIFNIKCKKDVWGLSIDIPGTISHRIAPLYS